MNFNFEEDFFREEIREDFRISSMMKKYWATCMKTLDAVAEVCKKYNIKYFADYGTLLGAVRHNGFIPWDDDMDISVMRKDYNRLLDILNKELADNYVVHSIYTKDSHVQAFTTILNRATIDVGNEKDMEISQEFFGCPYIGGVDIFPLDNIPDDEELRDTFIELYDSVYFISHFYDKIEANGLIDENLDAIEEMLNCKISRGDKAKTKKELRFLVDKVSGLFAEDQTRYCAVMADIGKLKFEDDKDYHEAFKETSWFETSTSHKFESGQIELPCGFDGVLKSEYGDYMTPRKYLADHAYPIYKSQEIKRRKYLGLSLDNMDSFDQ